MKNKKEIVTEEGFVLKFYPRETKEVSINISLDTLELLEKKSAEKDMTLKALLKFYISQGLRQDLSEAEASELFRKRMKSREIKTEELEAELVA